MDNPRKRVEAELNVNILRRENVLIPENSL